MHSVQQHVCMCGYIQFTISCSAVIIIVLCHVVVLYNNYGTFCLLLYMKWLRLSCVCTCTTYTISTQHQFTFTYTLRIHSMHANICTESYSPTMLVSVHMNCTLHCMCISVMTCSASDHLFDSGVAITGFYNRSHATLRS